MTLHKQRKLKLRGTAKLLVRCACGLRLLASSSGNCWSCDQKHHERAKDG